MEKKYFITLTPGVNFIKLFAAYFTHPACNQSENLREYTDSGVNYAQKSFVKLDTDVCAKKLTDVTD